MLDTTDVLRLESGADSALLDRDKWAVCGARELLKRLLRDRSNFEEELTAIILWTASPNST